MNVRSLSKHVFDIKFDLERLSSNVVCFTEIQLNPGQNVSWITNEVGMDMIFNNQSDKFCSLAIACLANLKLSHFENYPFAIYFEIDMTYPILFVNKVKILLLYRKCNSNITCFLNTLLQSLQKHDVTIIIGDFYFNALAEHNHPILLQLQEIGFVQIIDQATHIWGKCIDHVYIHNNFSQACNRNIKFEIIPTYYSDHEATGQWLKS